MPITIEHGGGDIGGLVGLAALVGTLQHQVPQAPGGGKVDMPSLPGGFGGGGGRRGGGGGMSSRDRFAMQAEELKGKRDEQMMQIDAQADLQKQSADDAMKRVAMEAGLDEEMKSQEYDREVKMMQEQAKADARKFKFEIGVEGKQELAKINRGRAAIRRDFAEGKITEEDAAAMDRVLTGIEAGIEPDAMPADPNKLPPLGEQVVTLPNGIQLIPARSATQLDPNKTVEGVERAEQRKVEAEERKARREFEDEAWKPFKNDLDDMVFPEANKVNAMLRDRYGPPAGETEEDRRAIAQGELSTKYGYPEDKPLPGQPGRPGEMQPTGEESNWWDALEAGVEGPGGQERPKIPVPEKYRKLPAKTGASLAIYDAYSKWFPSYDDVPDELKPAYDEILKEVESYMEEQRGKKNAG